MAHASRYARSERTVHAVLPEGGALLDYGCGEGELLWRLNASRPDARLFGFEPIFRPRADASALPYTHFSEIERCDDRFDVICAFEVLEHLSDHYFGVFVETVERTLVAGGRLVISVPIMQGPILIPKYLNARFVRRFPWNYTLGDLARASLLLGEVSRDPPADGKETHKGFSWRKLRRDLERHFVLERQEFSPMPWLWWGFNSQWFAVFRRR